MSTPLEFLVDWYATNDFLGTGTDVSERVDGSVGVVWSRGKDQIRQFAPSMAGQCAFMLNNLSKDYSPGNLSSPLIGLVLPGRKMRIQSTGAGGTGFDFEDGTEFEFEDGTLFDFTGEPGRVIWTGQTDEINQHPEARNVGFTCLGLLSRLRGKFITTALYPNILTSDFLGHVLDEAGWPAAERDIQTGLTTMTWAWADRDRDVFDIVQLIKDTEGPGAYVGEDPEGFFVFKNRDARTTDTRSTVSQQTFLDTDSINGLQYDPNFKDNVEAATLTVNERQAQGQSVLWELGDTLTLTNSEVRRFQVRSTTGDPFMNAVLPSPTPNDTIQTATASETLTSGTFKLRFREVTTASALDWDSTAAEWETALEGLSTIGSGNVMCAGGPISTTPINITFIGSFAGQSITDLIEAVDVVLNPVSAPATVELYSIQDGDGIQAEVQGIRASGVLTAGSYLIEWNPGSGFSSNIAYNANAAAVQTAVRAAYIGALVSGTALSLSGGGFTVNLLVSTNETLGVVLPQTSITSLVGTASINVVASTLGGTADYVLTAGGVTFTFDRTSGARVMLTATAGSTGATATGLRVRGDLVSVVRTHEVTYPEDVTDIPSGKIVRLNALPNVSLETARQQVSGFVLRYLVSHPTVVLTIIQSLYDSANDTLYQREIGDRITIVETQTGLNEDYHIEHIQQSIQGLALVTVFGCEQVVDILAGPPLFWY